MKNNNLVEKYGDKSVLEGIYEEIQKVYLNDDRPWCIGYSGGKDSTLTLIVCCEAISRLPEEQRAKEIHVVSSDTSAENPIVLNYLEQNLQLLEKFSKKTRLPIKVKMVKPETEETFLSLLLGRGYPSPRQKFRWCTERLKIKPMDKYINDIANEHGSVVVILGVRSDESNSRAASIAKHTVEGKILKTHATNQQALTYAPIEHLTTQDVWDLLVDTISPWGSDNHRLRELYRESTDEFECVLKPQLETFTCGNSRFGCWLCTVVSKDKSITGFIKNGYEELLPLLRFRNFLAENRDNPEFRNDFRTNGGIYYVGNGENEHRGLGCFSLNGRIKLMTALLKAEVEFNNLLQISDELPFSVDKSKYYELITKKELLVIRDKWIEDGDWNDTLPEIYRTITGREFYSGYVNQPFINATDQTILGNICEETGVSEDLIKSLITLENKYAGINNRRGIYEKIDRILNQDIVHEALYEEYRNKAL